MTGTSVFERYFYHGSPCSIDTFSFKFTGQANAQNGSGFYFITSLKEARVYCENRESSKFSFDEIKPTIHKVKLKIGNPLQASTVQPLTVEEVKALMHKAPDLLAQLADYGDVDLDGLDAVMSYAAEMIAGNDEDPLIHSLNMIATDFFGQHTEAFNHAVKDLLGYDGLIARAEDNDWFAVAWFPEQIQIVERIPFRERSLHQEEGMAP